MRPIYWLEYRQSRALLIAAALMLIGPHVFAAGYALWPWANAMHYTHIEGAFFVAAVYSLAFTQLIWMLWGGHAIAGERVDRTAEFLGLLPIARWRRLVAKLVVALGSATAVWGVNAAAMAVVIAIDPDVAHGMGIGRSLSLIAVTGWCMFGVGWFFSSFLSSSTFAIGAGVIAPVLIGAAGSAIGWAMGWRGPPYDAFMFASYVSVCGLLGTGGLAAGSWCFLRRVEP